QRLHPPPFPYTTLFRSIECPATPSFTAPTASDACGGATVVQDSDTTAAGSWANNYSETVTWHAVDACGNTSAQKSRTVTVRDTRSEEHTSELQSRFDLV